MTLDNKPYCFQIWNYFVKCLNIYCSPPSISSSYRILLYKLCSFWLACAISYIYLFCFYFVLFRAIPQHMEVHRPRGQIRAAAADLRPQPQHCQIWATSVTYTTANGNAGSLTLWARPGIEPAFSWTLVHWFTTVEPQRKVSHFVYLNSAFSSKTCHFDIEDTYAYSYT